MSTIAMILTSSDGDGALGRPTGAWLEELATPYWTFVDSGHDVVLASTAGGRPPLDPASLQPDAITAGVRRFQHDQHAMSALGTTVPAATLRPDDIDALFLVGGHGTMWDFPAHEPLSELVGRAAQRAILAAVCHGAAGLLAASPLGTALLAGRTIAAFSDAEEEAVGAADRVPFSLEQRIRHAGAAYTAGPIFAPHAVRDGNLITGQNPASSSACAALVVGALQEATELALQ